MAAFSSPIKVSPFKPDLIGGRWYGASLLFVGFFFVLYQGVLNAGFFSGTFSIWTGTYEPAFLFHDRTMGVFALGALYQWLTRFKAKWFWLFAVFSLVGAIGAAMQSFQQFGPQYSPPTGAPSGANYLTLMYNGTINIARNRDVSNGMQRTVAASYPDDPSSPGNIIPPAGWFSYNQAVTLMYTVVFGLCGIFVAAIVYNRRNEKWRDREGDGVSVENEPGAVRYPMDLTRPHRFFPGQKMAQFSHYFPTGFSELREGNKLRRAIFVLAFLELLVLTLLFFIGISVPTAGIAILSLTGNPLALLALGTLLATDMPPPDVPFPGMSVARLVEKSGESVLDKLNPSAKERMRVVNWNFLRLAYMTHETIRLAQIEEEGSAKVAPEEAKPLKEKDASHLVYHGILRGDDALWALGTFTWRWVGMYWIFAVGLGAGWTNFGLDMVWLASDNSVNPLSDYDGLVGLAQAGTLLRTPRLNQVTGLRFTFNGDPRQGLYARLNFAYQWLTLLALVIASLIFFLLTAVWSINAQHSRHAKDVQLARGTVSNEASAHYRRVGRYCDCVPAAHFQETVMAMALTPAARRQVQEEKPAMDEDGHKEALQRLAAVM